MSKLKIALCGCGGRSMAHLPHLKDFGETEVVGFYDIRPERAEEKQAFMGTGRVYRESVEEMLDDCRPDALYICVPPDQHGKIELAAAERGINFFVEKPLALDMETAEKIRDAAAAKGLITCVGFQDRYLDIVRMTREFIANREVALVDGAWIGGIPGVYWWPTYATSGGQIVEQNIHHFDLSRYLFGEPEKVYCTARKGIVKRDGYDLHDCSSAVITFKSGVIANIFTGCYVTAGHPGYRNGLRIHCTDAEVDYQLRNNVTFKTSEYTKNFLRVESHERAINRAYIDALLTGDQSKVKSPYADACKSLALTLACNESVFTGRVIEL